uniref:Uncharacterized protein n=1 Tax=Neogobius melanostomus TaxID=47308 RepID=A0A8C6TGZ9_9GOBI
MEDGSKAPHSMGSGGQQRNHHPRPFFYVQPPSQPYYMPQYQQWQMNNPYGQYAMPAGNHGFNFGRPCVNPYQYMQYPGFIYPNAPLYPMDVRRMFEPRFPSPHWDTSGRPPPPHPPEHRETASSGAQTDPSDAIAKLIQRLDKMQTGAELDSGVASQSSAMFSPTEEKKSKQQKAGLNVARGESCAETPFSTIAVYDGDSSLRSLEEVLNPRECCAPKLWAGGMEDEEEPPLDSSSVQEDNAEKAEEQVVPIETTQNAADIQKDVDGTDQNVPPSDELQEHTAKMRDKLKSREAHLEEKAVDIFQDSASFQILKLPFELSSEAKGLSPLTRSPYYYNYLRTPSTHERMSVLSPSLDELSSRDEMFSTDLEEVELFPRRVYAGGRRLAEVVCAGGGGSDVDEIWTIGSKRFVCACCGKSLPRGAAMRSKVHCSKVYLDEGGDSDDEGR